MTNTMNKASAEYTKLYNELKLEFDNFGAKIAEFSENEMDESLIEMGNIVKEAVGCPGSTDSQKKQTPSE
jgi:hypothetical protein